MTFLEWLGSEEPQTAKEDLPMEVREQTSGMLGSDLIAMYPNWRSVMNWGSTELLAAEVVDSKLCGDDSDDSEYYRVIISRQ